MKICSAFEVDRKIMWKRSINIHIKGGKITCLREKNWRYKKYTLDIESIKLQEMVWDSHTKWVLEMEWSFSISIYFCLLFLVFVFLFSLHFWSVDMVRDCHMIHVQVWPYSDHFLHQTMLLPSVFGEAKWLPENNYMACLQYM